MRWIGRQIGPGQRFRIVKKLGERSLLETYRAQAHRGEEDAVLKVLDESLARDRDLIARLEAEVELQAAVSHPRLVTFDGHFRRADSLALHRTYIEGENLSERLARTGPLAAREARRLLGDLLEPIGAAHAAGLCHLGLSARNVLVCFEGGREVPFVVDLGIARVLGSHWSETDRRASPFAAPELVRPEVSLDARVDVYALGVLLRTLVVGSVEASPKSAPRTLSEPLATVVRRATAEAPRERFENALELLDVLRSLEDIDITGEGLELPVRPPEAAPKAALRGARKPPPRRGPATDLGVGWRPTPEPPTGRLVAAEEGSLDEALAALLDDSPPEATLVDTRVLSTAELLGLGPDVLAPFEELAPYAIPADTSAAERPQRQASMGAPGLSPTDTYTGLDPLSVAPPETLAHTQESGPHVALRHRDRVPNWQSAPTARTLRPAGLAPGAPLDQANQATSRLETPRVPPLAVGARAPEHAELGVRTVTADVEAAAERGAVGALNDEPEDISRKPVLGGRYREVSSPVRAADGSESRQVRALPFAYMTAPPTASLPAVGETLRPRRPRLLIPVSAAFAVAVLAVLAIKLFGPPLDIGAEEATPAALATPSSVGELGAAPSNPAGPGEPAEALGAAVPEAGLTEVLADAAVPDGATAWVDHPAPDAGRENSLGFDSSLWNEGNIWLLHRRVDSSDPLLAGEYYLRREIVAAEPHPWGQLVTLRETGGTEPPRTRAFIASTGCLIDPLTERIELCLPARSDELEARQVVGRDTLVFRSIHDGRELVFGPAVGWVEEDVFDERGTRYLSRLVGLRRGAAELGELDRAVETCAWTATASGGPGIGHTERAGGLTPELLQAQAWGLRGRLRRLELPLSGRFEVDRVRAWYSRYQTAYGAASSSTPRVSDEVVPMTVLDLPLDQTWTWEAEDADVVALLFEKDGVSAVHLVWVSDDGVEQSVLLEPDASAPNVARLELAPSPDGCALRLARRPEGLVSIPLGPNR